MQIDRRAALQMAGGSMGALFLHRAFGQSNLPTNPIAAQRYQPTWDSLNSRPTPSWYTDAKFGLIICWGLYSVPAYAPVDVSGEQPYAEWYWNAITVGREHSDPRIQAAWQFHQRTYGANFPYKDFASEFRAELFDPTAWADLFQQSGAKYVVLTSKHHDGYTLWPSREASVDWGRPWNSVETGPHRDLVDDVTKAVRAKGLKMGLYYSLYEWYNPLWLTDKPRFIRQHVIPQFKDLVSRYEPSLIFADGEWDLSSAEWHSPELLAWLFNDSPSKDEVVINDRWGKETRHKDGGYWTTEYTAGMSNADHPWEENRGMGFSYGYNRNERLEQYRSARELILTLVDTVSRGGNLLLDVGPAADGSIPVIMEERLLQIGSWLKINGDAIYGTHALQSTRQYSAGRLPEVHYDQRFHVPYDVAAQTTKSSTGEATIEAFFTAKGNDIYAILPNWPKGRFVLSVPQGKPVNAVALLGSNAALRFRSTSTSVTLDPDDLPEELRTQPAWTLKLQR